MTDTNQILDAAALTRHVEARYHARHREQLPPLVRMAEKVEAAHAGADHVPAGLAHILKRMTGELEVHMKKEELILFPAIRRGGGRGIENPIAVMRADHDSHERDLADIRRLTRDFAVPDGACGTWIALYAGLAEFVGDLTAHIHLENTVLFPQFEPGGASYG